MEEEKIVKKVSDTFNYLFKTEYKNFTKEASKSKEIISIIIKNHLYIEFCLNEILKNSLPKPVKVVEHKKSESRENFSFYQKALIFESLNLNIPKLEDRNLVKRIMGVNQLRNFFSHELSAETNFYKNQEVSKILKILYEDVEFDLQDNEIGKLKKSMIYIVVHLHIIRILQDFFPLYLYTVSNKGNLIKECICATELDNILEKEKELLKIFISGGEDAGFRKPAGQ